MLYVLIALISIIIGVIAGAFLMTALLKAFEYKGPKEDPKYSKRRSRNKVQKRERGTESNANETDPQVKKSRLTNMVDKSESHAEWNMDMEGIEDDATEVLSNMRRKEDSAYNYLNTIIKNTEDTPHPEHELAEQADELNLMHTVHMQNSMLQQELNNITTGNADMF